MSVSTEALARFRVALPQDVRLRLVKAATSVDLGKLTMLKVEK